MVISTFGTVTGVTPTVFKTFFQHYYRQAKKAKADRRIEATDEFLFDEAFHIVKRFLALSTKDTVRALQAFTNTYVPAQPWSTTVPVCVPLACCDEAASLLIEYFGEGDLRDVVGGSKWWQVRALDGIEAEWVAQSTDWRRANRAERMAEQRGERALRNEAKTRYRDAKRNHRHERQASKVMRRKLVQATTSPASPAPVSPGAVDDEGRDDASWQEELGEEERQRLDESFEELDRLRRVMLYVPGGGYYFGSPNTHRYQVARLARKYGGRAFVVNYRKAPNYPWPCPVQDALAAYLYLIRPPPGARHRAVDPAQLVVAGDSAGGGLSLALLAVLRDLNLPMPAGAVLISPWCDLTHSMPSILQNTQTDIIPPYGFIHKPSTLWPVRQSVADPPNLSGGDSTSNLADERQRAESDGVKLYREPSKLFSKSIQVPFADGGSVELRQQIQLYATNDQLTHPLCSPLLQGSLGGLPPLYILAGDAEVLRDEIIYLAHRAAKPDQYTLSDRLLSASSSARESARRFNPIPTKVHLQVFDDQCHVLTLFSFTTSSIYAYRAIASFMKHVTGAPSSIVSPFSTEPDTPRAGEDAPKGLSPLVTQDVGTRGGHNGGVTAEPLHASPTTVSAPHSAAAEAAPPTSARRDDSAAYTAGPGADVVDVPASDRREVMERKRRNVTLGSENIYDAMVPLRRPTYVHHMIRERVDIRGRLRELEPEEKLQALCVPRDEIGVLKEGPVRRYLEGQQKWDHRYARTARRVEKRRLIHEETARRLIRRAVRRGLFDEAPADQTLAVPREQTSSRGAATKMYGPLDCLDERVPPSALAGRRDCSEAIGLLRLHLRLRTEQAGWTRSRRYMDRIYGEAFPALSGSASRVQTSAPGSEVRPPMQADASGAAARKGKQAGAVDKAVSKAKAARRGSLRGRSKASRTSFGLAAWMGTMSALGRKRERREAEATNAVEEEAVREGEEEEAVR